MAYVSHSAVSFDAEQRCHQLPHAVAPTGSEQSHSAPFEEQSRACFESMQQTERIEKEGTSLLMVLQRVDHSKHLQIESATNNSAVRLKQHDQWNKHNCEAIKSILCFHTTSNAHTVCCKEALHRSTGTVPGILQTRLNLSEQNTT